MKKLNLEVGKTYVDSNGVTHRIDRRNGDEFFDDVLGMSWWENGGRANGLGQNLMTEANTQGGSAHEKCRSPYCECDEGKCREGKVDARGEAAAALLAKPDPIPHADLIRAVLDGKTVQRSVASIRGGEQTWDNVDYEDPRLAIKELLTPPTEWIKFRIKPEPVVRWAGISSSEGRIYVGESHTKREHVGNSGYIAQGLPIQRIQRTEYDPDTLDVISAHTEAP
jgi:hypothetical protein